MLEEFDRKKKELDEKYDRSKLTEPAEEWNRGVYKNPIKQTNEIVNVKNEESDSSLAILS